MTPELEAALDTLGTLPECEGEFDDEGYCLECGEDHG